MTLWKTQPFLANEEAVLLLLFGLLRSGQIKLCASWDAAV